MVPPNPPQLSSLPADQAVQALQSIPLGSSLGESLGLLRQVFARCSDLVVHQLAPGAGSAFAVIYIDGLIDQDLLDRDVVRPLLERGSPSAPMASARSLTYVPETARVRTHGELVQRLVSGEAILLADGSPEGVAYGLQGWETRAISEPVAEAAIRGPRESFVETLRFNTAMLRRKLKSPGLKTEALTIGRVTRTDVVVAYLEGIADPGVIAEVHKRLQHIEIDGVLETGYLEEFLEDAPFSPFPQIQNTERPDTAAGQLLEGRVAILVDGTPVALIVPTVFAQFMQANEDYYERFLIASAVRMLRYLFLLVALLLPSLYVAVITFHHEMMPTSLLLSIAEAREGVPFPALVEAMAMEVTFEVLREAGIRLPKPVGQAVSIVGALVIGEAAVRAGLVSAPMVIVVAITGIASFAVPRYNAATAVRMLRFPLILLAGTLGMFGIVAGLSGILLHLCALRSFGVPYLSPMGPMDWQGLKDVLIRAPHWAMRLRPRLVGGQNRVRVGKGLAPGPPPRSGGGR
jgi:spore germination protein KA